jgi:hypothetical protein
MTWTPSILKTYIQVVEHLPSKHKALSSNPSITKKDPHEKENTSERMVLKYRNHISDK